MKVDILALLEKNLYEGVYSATKEEQGSWSSGKLYYVIRGKENEIVEYIDTNKVNEYNELVGKKYKPKQVAEFLFENRGIFVEEEYVAESVAKKTKISSDVELDVDERASS